ncbi:hypothetical protein SAMN05444141_109295 [Pseudovibrio denitrificans]|uniref:Uncharacterized protein n=1 Tax=Pseudovibrio denitrificans TaxID=258256 RepID=A0A1I7DPR4_9HYPH|nr:hypothetical protein [Pseudovibrio denitrificans]SFU13657.1 hypothetical protein SAMN05444141_109295 [Pseudovibrio denitrificans]
MFKRRLLLSAAGAFAAGIVSFSSGANSLSFEGVPYVDDRSSPVGVLESYYFAILRQAYPQAFSYFRSPPGAFEDWKNDFRDEVKFQLRYGKVEPIPSKPQPGMTQIYWKLPVAVKLHYKDGSSQVYAGCYVFHMAMPDTITEPPYSPITIESVDIGPSDKPLDDAKPASCDDDE